MAFLSVMLLVLVSACSGPFGLGQPSTPAYQAKYAAAACPTPNLPGVPQLEFGSDFSCGYLTVPENRAKPSGRQIRIAVARARGASLDRKPDPVVWLTGGPGYSALADAPFLVKVGVNANRDVIFIDQRGTLHSDPRLSCPEIDAFQEEAFGLATSEPTTGQKDLAAVRACRDRLAQKGYDLSAYNTTENAADVADLRVALGIKEWNVYGVSYGADLAQHLVRDHPQGIRSVVLDSVAPNTVNLIDQFWPNAAHGFRALFDGCAAQPPCAEAYPRLASELTTAVNQLSRTPLTVEVPNPSSGQPTRVVLDGYQLANVVVHATAGSDSIAGVPALVHKIAMGDGARAAKVLLSTFVPPDLFGYGLTFGVFCRESVAFTSPQQMQMLGQQALPDFPAEVLRLPPQMPRIFDQCAVWNVGKADRSVFNSTRSSVPVLILAGSYDPLTPPSWGELAAKTLPNSRVLRFPGAGHIAILSRSCAFVIVLAFLDQPRSGYDTGCLSRETPPMFETYTSSVFASRSEGRCLGDANGRFLTSDKYPSRTSDLLPWQLGWRSIHHDAKRSYLLARQRGRVEIPDQR
jgi:pimeloyl-ACP methyl ester carboxylesterase